MSTCRAALNAAIVNGQVGLLFSRYSCSSLHFLIVGQSVEEQRRGMQRNAGTVGFKGERAGGVREDDAQSTGLPSRRCRRPTRQKAGDVCAGGYLSESR